MNAMEKMLANMLQSMVPPELLAALTPEKMQEYSEGVKSIIVSFQMRLDAIEDTQKEILERLEHVGNNNSSPKRGTRARLTNASGSGSD